MKKNQCRDPHKKMEFATNDYRLGRIGIVHTEWNTNAIDVKIEREEAKTIDKMN